MQPDWCTLVPAWSWGSCNTWSLAAFHAVDVVPSSTKAFGGAARITIPVDRPGELVGPRDNYSTRHRFVKTANKIVCDVEKMIAIPRMPSKSSS